jgi:hypothetical protein
MKLTNRKRSKVMGISDIYTEDESNEIIMMNIFLWDEMIYLPVIISEKVDSLIEFRLISIYPFHGYLRF